MKPFKPRKKKIHIVPCVKNMKSVRIDQNTVICVSADISDNDARQRFLARYKCGPHAPDQFIPPPIKRELAKVDCVGSLEEMEEMLDDSSRPDPE